jgi:hypothetical protein
LGAEEEELKAVGSRCSAREGSTGNGLSHPDNYMLCISKWWKSGKVDLSGSAQEDSNKNTR